MYVSRLRLWNFRKFGTNAAISSKLDAPDLEIEFKEGLNALIGPNDSGKTAAIDALKLVLGIHSTEWSWFNDDDFYQATEHLRIECVLEGFDIGEGKNFTEWSTFDGKGKQTLTVRINAYKRAKGIVGDVKAGADEGTILPAEARSRLKAVYLKPLRDAQNELLARKNSRLSQILKGHTLFKHEDASGSVTLKEHVNTANDGIGGYFQTGKDGHTHITKILEDPLKDFFDDTTSGIIDVGDTYAIKSVLEKLSLRIDNLQNPGLGSLNRLFIAIELLLFLANTNEDGAAHIALIEELEAHLHPQAQLKVAQYLQSKCDDGQAQIIITTHSPTLASKIKLRNLLLFASSDEPSESCFNLGAGKTKLRETDYQFLERFLDSTKANLFFARGVLIVEGDAENLLIPSIAAKIGKDLTKNGVSIVNVGSTAYMRYARIFQRTNGATIPIKVSAIIDLDVPPAAYRTAKPKTTLKTEDQFTVAGELDNLRKQRVGFDADDYVKGFVSKYWTLEYCIALSTELRTLLYEAVLRAKEEDRLDKNPNVTIKENSVLKAEAKSYVDGLVNDGKSETEIAFDIYYEKIKKPKLSKASVAQHLATLIDETPDLTFGDDSVAYLVSALTHAIPDVEESPEE